VCRWFGYGDFGVTASVPIVASRVSLPDIAGSAELLELLWPEWREVYSTGAGILRVGPRPPAPKPFMGVSPTEYKRLLRRMQSCGMLDWTDSPVAVNGVFGVDKDDGASIRLILDLRPGNTFFEPPPNPSLTTPDFIARMRVRRDRRLYTAKLDISDFYHRIRIPAWLRPYFALPAVRVGDLGPEVVRATGGDPDRVLHPMCSTLPMGWSHSVFVAQLAHEYVITSFTRLKPTDRLGAFDVGFDDFNLRDGRILYSVYIDDSGFFGYDPAELNAVVDEYMAAVRRFGLDVKPSKVVRPTCEPVTVLGIEVDGVSKIVRVPPAKLHALCRATWAVANSRALRVSGARMAQLIGCWTWAMLVARPALCAFSRCYAYIQHVGMRGRARLWASVREELLVVLGLAPLLFADIGAHDFAPIVATDASTEWGFGVVAWTPGRGEWLAPWGPTHIEHSRAGQGRQPLSTPFINDTSLGRDGDASSAAEVAACERQNEALRPTDDGALCDGGVDICSARWATIVSQRWRGSASEKPVSINVLELAAVRTAIRWMYSKGALAIGARAALLVDNTAVVGALRKGRSGSWAFLQRLRGVNALLLAGGLRLNVQYVPSALNPADGPSRGVVVRCFSEDAA
jgi:hypothetical protein